MGWNGDNGEIISKAPTRQYREGFDQISWRKKPNGVGNLFKKGKGSIVRPNWWTNEGPMPSTSVEFTARDLNRLEECINANGGNLASSLLAFFDLKPPTGEAILNFWLRWAEKIKANPAGWRTELTTLTQLSVT